MQRFQYIVSTNSGIHKSGAINAANEAAANSELAQKGLMVISLIEQKHVRDWFWQKPHLSFQEKMMFTKHLSTMIRVGITITEAMEILADQSREKNNKKMFQTIVSMIQSGRTLSHSLAEYPYVFPDVFIKMVQAGEESGTLEAVLEYLDLQLEKEYELRKRVISALVYPAVIVSITLIISLGIIVFLMPRIMRIFESFDVELPLPTRIMIGMSTFITTNPLLSIFGAVAIVIAIISLLRWKKLKPFWDTILLRMPIFGKLMRNVNLAQFTRTLSSLFSAGIPIIHSLEIVKNASSNHLYRKAIEEVAGRVERGGALGEAFEGKERLFPVMMTKMFYIGERTGSLESTTQHLAILYEREVDSMTRNLTVLLEPLLLVFMGVLVGGVAISIILPIYQLPNLL